MSSGINKEWINEKNIETDTYRDGVLQFLHYVRSNSSNAKHSCPCRRCRNGKGHVVIDDIFVHLMTYGMDMNYTLWHFHGETLVVDQVQPPPQSVTPTEHADVHNIPILNDLVNDACEMFMGEAEPSEPNCVGSDEAPPTSEVPNDSHTHKYKGKKYDRLHQLAQEPLHPATGSSRHTTMYALIKLNDLKTQFNLSDGATGGILRLLNELLPEENNLTTSYTEMKNTVRDLGMDYVKYDVCINNCMLFWKEHEKSTRYLKCGSLRYKFTCLDEDGVEIQNTNGKKVL